VLSTVLLTAPLDNVAAGSHWMQMNPPVVRLTPWYRQARESQSEHTPYGSPGRPRRRTPRGCITE